METQPIYSKSEAPRLYLGRWAWKIKDRIVMSEPVVTVRIPFNYQAMKAITHIRKRAIKALKIPNKQIDLLLASGQDPLWIDIDERTYAGTSFQTIEQIMENQTIPEKKTYVNSCFVWNEFINVEREKEYYQKLIDFLKEENKTKTVYPKPDQIFYAFKMTPFNLVRVVIIGQDPYHTPQTAHGLAFSSVGMNTPPSLLNIYKEAYIDLKIGLEKPYAEAFNINSLTNWAKQGVLLLNRCLTVRNGEAGSHQKKGWEEFTNAVIMKLNQTRKPIVYMLWGKSAQELKPLIDPRNLILEAAHPSPLSANNGFFGCNHFSQANTFIKDHYGKIIHWENNKNTVIF